MHLFSLLALKHLQDISSLFKIPFKISLYFHQHLKSQTEFSDFLTLRNSFNTFVIGRFNRCQSLLKV